MKKKSFLILASLSTFLLITALLFNNSTITNDEKTYSYKEDDATNPGYFQQWYDMRKNKHGEIPLGNYQKWMTADRKNATKRSKTLNGSSFFCNITELSTTNEGGRTRAISINPNNLDDILAGGVSGGMWRSNDGGTSWNSINEHAASLAVSSITRNPSNSDEVYYGTGEGMLGGRIISGDGIFRSLDGGDSFSQLFSTNDEAALRGVWKIEHAKDGSNTVYVGCPNEGLYRITDANTANASITKVLYGNISDIICFNDGSVLAARAGHEIYHSPDGTNGSYTSVFNSTDNAFPTGTIGKIEIEECANKSDTLYALFEGDPSNRDGVIALCRSTDGGLNWTARTIENVGSVQSNYCMMLGVHANDPDKVYIGAQFSKRSFDGGLSWVSAAYSHADKHLLVNIPGTEYALEGSDGGISKVNWDINSTAYTNLKMGYNVTQFYAGDFAPESEGSLIVGGTQDNGSFKLSTNTYKRVLGSDGAYAHISQQNPDLAYACTQNGGIKRYTNFTNANPSYSNIQSSAMSSEGFNFINPYQINYDDGNQLYMRTDLGLWRTINTGSNWVKILSTLAKIDLYAIGVSRDDDPRVYVGGSKASLYRIDNAKTTAIGNEVNLSLSVPASITHDFISAITPYGNNSSKAYISFTTHSDESRVWRITNGNTSSPIWTDISGDLPQNLPVNYIQMDPYSPDNIIFAGTDFGLYYTTNGGANWIKEEGIPNVQVTELKMRATDRKLFLFTYGRGVWTADLNGNQFATVPFCENFESGLSGNNWILKSSGPEGLIEIADHNGPNNGSYHAIMTKSVSGQYNQNEMQLLLNLDGMSDLELKFSWKDINDENHTEDGVYISDDNGASFSKVFTFSGNTNTYHNETIDLSTAIVTAGLAPTDKFIVKFQQYDNNDLPLDGIAIDDVCVTGVHYASLPFCDDFESGTLNTSWKKVHSTPNGAIKVSDTHQPNSGNYHVTMATNKKTPLLNQNEFLLHLDLTGQQALNLNFAWKDLGDEDHPQDGVYFSDDGGNSFIKVFTFSGTTSTYQTESLDLSALIASNGLNYSSNFIIKFQQYDNHPAGMDGIALDDVCVKSRIHKLPFCEYFESGNLSDNGWYTQSSLSSGLIEVTPYYGPYGNYHALMSKDPFSAKNYNQNEMWLRLDITNESEITLKFNWKDLDDEDHSQDGVYISDNGGSSFYKVYTFSGTTNTYNSITIHLGTLIDTYGLDRNDDFVIKFQQYDNSYIAPIIASGNDYDGILIDNICILGDPVLDQIKVEKDHFVARKSSLQNSKEINMSLYPNPSKGVFNLQLEEVEQIDAMQIVDINGKSISFKKENNGSGQWRIELESASNGVYLLNLSIGEQRLMKRILIQ